MMYPMQKQATESQENTYPWGNDWVYLEAGGLVLLGRETLNWGVPDKAMTMNRAT